MGVDFFDFHDFGPKRASFCKKSPKLDEKSIFSNLDIIYLKRSVFKNAIQKWNWFWKILISKWFRVKKLHFSQFWETIRNFEAFLAIVLLKINLFQNRFYFWIAFFKTLLLRYIMPKSEKIDFSSNFGLFCRNLPFLGQNHENPKSQTPKFQNLLYYGHFKGKM